MRESENNAELLGDIEPLNPVMDLEQRMAVLGRTMTKKQRMFAEAIAGGSTQAEAGRIADYSSNSVKTGTILKSIKVQDYLTLCIEREVLKQGFHLGWKRKELVKTYRQARELGQTAAAIQAIKTLAQLDGDWMEGPAVQVNVSQPPALSDSDIDALVEIRKLVDDSVVSEQ
ncbi:MAG: hypothetical protein AAGB19_02485 [Cyanobacteria bacterium P01_F01_bin.3]